MMSQDQSLMDRLENRFGVAAHHEAAPKKVWAKKVPAGIHPRFKGMQEVRIAAVGDAGPEHALIEVWDTKDSVMAWKTGILVPGEQLQHVLGALLKAEEVEADLVLTPKEHRPVFPIVVDEVPGSMGLIKVILDEYNDRIQVKLSHSIHGRRSGGGWLSVGVEDIQPIGSMLLKVLKSIPAADGAPADSAEVELPF